MSAFQINFGSRQINTAGDAPDVLVAMNPAALKVNLRRVRQGGSIIVNVDAFEKRNLDLAGYKENPLADDSLHSFRVIPVELTKLTRESLKETGLNVKEIDRSKNMFALGLALWIYSRPIEPAIDWLTRKFARKPEVLDANLMVLKKGYHYGETTEQFAVQYAIEPATLEKGRYRAIHGYEALALGLIAASQRARLPLFYGSYPITPASDLLHELSRHKNFGILTFQAEDEIAAIGSVIGAAFGGSLAVTGTSGPGVALKAEAIGLAVMTELPLVVVNMQRGGPSTGLPTKTEQSDLLQAFYGRNGEAPLPIIAPSTPGDCFFAAYEACRIALKYMTPVMLLADGYLGSGSEPWKIPNAKELPEIPVRFAGLPNTGENGEARFLPYLRDEATLARPWARPGTAGLEHRIGGLEKQHETGDVSYDPENHQLMTHLRAEKVERIAQDIPPTPVYGDEEGQMLIIGWGSTRGAIVAAVDRARARGQKVGAIHLRHVNPFPSDLELIYDRFEHLLVPELNNGQLVRILRDRYLRPFIPLNKVKGLPFKAVEIEAKLDEVIGSVVEPHQ